MDLFSRRYGYEKPMDTLIRERITTDISNAICTAYDKLNDSLNRIDINAFGKHDVSYTRMELAIWIHFENKRQNDFYTFSGHKVVATEYIESTPSWYKTLDMVEFSIQWMEQNFKDEYRCNLFKSFVDYLNARFKELGFAYRIVNCRIVEITTEEEIREIEQALTINDIIFNHIGTALTLLSQKPVGDYRNSIKESISAVEYICREYTSKSTLGEALKELEHNGLSLPKMLKDSFEKLYAYTNNPTTGIRHALMEDAYAPSFDEAKFMVVACSAFVNYIKAKHA